MYSSIKEERRSPQIAFVFFNRPEKRNAMSPDVHKEMLDCLTRLRNDKELRVLVVSGVGESFCAGMDLEKFFVEQRPHPERMDESRRIVKDWMEMLRVFPKITIAAINGWCFGAAFRVIGNCDIAIASDKATFGLSEINFGIFPGGGVMKTVADLLRPRDALFLALSGEPITAETAKQVGLVTKVVPHEKLYESVYDMAQKLSVHNPVAVRVTKEVFRRVGRFDDDTAYDFEIAKMDELSYLQKDEWKNVALKKFQRREFKPGLGSYLKDSSKNDDDEEHNDEPKGTG